MGNFRCVQHPFHYYSFVPHSILRTSPPLTWRVIRVISTITITARAPRPLGRRHRCCLAAYPFNDVYFFTFSANNAYDEDRSKRKLVRRDCVQCAWTRTENWFNVLCINVSKHDSHIQEDGERKNWLSSAVLIPPTGHNLWGGPTITSSVYCRN